MDVFVVLLTVCLSGVVSLTLDDLYPYNVTSDDQLLHRNDDGSSSEILFSFPFYNNSRSSAFVNTNGDITFGNSLSQYRPSAFPLPGNYVMVAVFWTDIITYTVGEIWYKLSSNQDLLDRATSDVRSAFTDQTDFSSSLVFVVTWNEVPYYGASGDNLLLRNTFQIVLTTDGTKSFVMFHYYRLDWANGALVGFNAGDGVNSYTVNGSMSDDIVNLVNRSNTGVPGKFLFRVDGVEIQPAGQNITSRYRHKIFKWDICCRKSVKRVNRWK
ncbi:sushi, nidogen and EGF-like domain-containing protein 1 [Ylistrum balloti]|uniref:sushi, nidogen and EGF-like domain-containing protein 1 n=1 Tax=Ylistrum balloti TaxID=509963 RepID=UPI002905C824|nr:sushi, nidogen and EGF-like domain-containing protein 1 [Ylistrum balloti]